VKEYVNEGNIYIDQTTPPGVVELYRQQFQKDMLLFLKSRYEELVLGGQMVLTFLGRKYEDVYNNGYLNHPWGLLARSLQSLVEEVCSLNLIYRNCGTNLFNKNEIRPGD
jgi:hypothetical protein